MLKETERLIRLSVRNLLSNTDLSEYKIRKIVKAEIENPRRWSSPDDEDCHEDMGIIAYYGHLRDQYVFLNFVDHMHAHYGFYYFKHLKREA